MIKNTSIYFKNNTNLPSIYYKHQYTSDEIIEYQKCINDPVYFACTYMKIVNVDKGLIPFSMWDFQKELVNAFHNNRFIIAKYCRQSGKSTCSIAYLLHYILFNEDVNVAILANKLATAKELLGRLQLAYEYLPFFLKQGIKIWNKTRVELANGSRILSDSTSGASVRGQTFNCILLDEFAFVPNHIAEQFFNATYPTISSGNTTKVIIVSTPHGLNMFYRLWEAATDSPPRNYYIPKEVHWSMVPGRDEKWKEETIKNTSPEQFQQEFETEFIGSANTLINPAILRTLKSKNPLYKEPNLDIYELPIPNHTYVMVVDVAEGQNLDYSAFQIIDVTSVPYKQVAKFRDNKMPPILFPTTIYSAGKRYNDAYILVELNNVGLQVADALHLELNYENLIKIAMKGRQGQRTSSGFLPKVAYGVKTSTQTKRIGCSNLKTLIEGNKLIIQDFDTLAEMNTFVQNKQSFCAEEGYNDDLVMCLVNFGWLISQRNFKENINSNIREFLQNEKIRNNDSETIIPFGIIDDGRKPKYEVDSKGDAWEIDERYIYSGQDFRL